MKAFVKQPVGVNRDLDGASAVNTPEDVHTVARRLADLGNLVPDDLTRADAAGTPPPTLQTGYFNRERAIELFDQHDWGTSWLAEMIEAAGAAYCKSYLKDNPFAALITLNDASLPMGGASPDHRGHQTGLTVDVFLPRKDGTVRRLPQLIDFEHPQFDSSAMKAMLAAFDETKHLAGVIFDDPDTGYPLTRTTTPNNSLCRRHAEIRVKKPDRKDGSLPAGWSGMDAAARAIVIAQRLRSLGFASDRPNVDVGRHVFDDKGQPRKRKDGRYEIVARPYVSLQWATRLFKAIVNGKSIVPQNAGTVDFDDDDVKWLFAENAPTWVMLPVGTVEPSPQVIAAIRFFQAATSGAMTTVSTTGCVTPNDDLEDWLESADAPRSVPLRQQGADYEIAEVAHGQMRRFRTNVPKWTSDLVAAAAAKYKAARAGNESTWPPMRVRHPGAAYPGDAGAESGLRILLPVNGAIVAARAALAKSFLDAGAAKVIHKFETAEATNFTGVENTTSTELDGFIVVHAAKPTVALPVTPTVANKTAVFVTPGKPPATAAAYNELRQTPRLAVVTDDATGKVTSVGLEILRPMPDATAATGWRYDPLTFELPLKTPQTPPTLTPSGTETVRFVPTGDGAGERHRVVAKTSTITFAAAESWPLSLDPFEKRHPFLAKAFAPFSVSEARIEFDANFGSDPGKSCHLVCEFGRGLLANPVQVKIALAGPAAADVIASEMIVSYESAGDAPARAPLELLTIAESEQGESKFEDDEPTSAASSADDSDPGGNPGLFEGWRFRFPLPAVFQRTLPISNDPVKMTGAFDLLLGRDGAIGVNLHGDVSANLDLPLGSSMVRLTSTAPAKAFANLGSLGFDLTVESLPQIELVVDPFKRLDLGDSRTAALANAFTGGKGGLISIPLVKPADNAPISFVWSAKGPRISRAMIERLFDPELLKKGLPTIDDKRSLASLAGRLLGTSSGSAVTFAQSKDAAGNAKLVRFEIVGDKWELTVPIHVDVKDTTDNKPILSGDCELVLVAELKVHGNSVEFSAGSFECSVSNRLTVQKGGCHKSFGDLISMHVPEDTSFLFELDPKGPSLSWDPKPPLPGADPASISIRVPAVSASVDSDQKLRDEDKKSTFFAFDLDRFDYKPAGVSLHAGVRTNRVNLGASSEAVFAEPLSVQAKGKDNRGSRIGELEVINGRLVQGSLKAGGKLPYFDNANGTLTLVVTEDVATNKLDCLGTFDITGSEKFGIAPLYAQCEVRGLHLSTRYSKVGGEGKWSSDGSITGSVRFAPPSGRSSSDMGPLSNLFEGVTVEFEDMNLRRIASGTGQITLTCPPKSFRFGEILRVDLRGLELYLASTNGVAYPGKFELLGDVTLENLPGLDSSLTFGGITLAPGSVPEFNVKRIGGQISTAGGFSMEGVFEHVKSPTEVGFAGQFAVTMDSLPRIGGTIKLTRVLALDGRFVPSLAVFLEADVDIALFAGFFLRRVGAGIGIRQAIVGLDQPGPIREKILAFVDRPEGLPEPRNIESWVPVRPESASDAPSWMFVANGLITFGKLDNDQPHTFAGSILLAIDHRLDITLAANAWLFTSPDETLDREFQERPCVRGAIGLSVRDRTLFAYFKTLKDPKIGAKAPKPLAEALKHGETSLLLNVNRDGFLLEIGWPWETKYEFKFGPIDGEVRTGFRFGITRGVMIFGLNFAVMARLEAAERFDAGPGSVELAVRGSGSLRTQFLGAVTREFDVYLLGDISLAASLKLSVTLSWRISVKVFGKRYSKSFRKSASMDLSIQAGLTAAMDKSGSIGFRGTAQVAFSVAGFRLGGSAHFGYNEKLIDEVNQRLTELMPPDLRMTRHQATPTLPAPKPVWNYRYFRVPGQKRIRVAFFPAPGNPYPLHTADADRFKIVVLAGTEFRGFVGSSVSLALATDRSLTWTEQFEAVVIEEGDLLASLPPEDREELKKKGGIKQTLEQVLKNSDSKDRWPTLSGTEFRDDRTRQHGSARPDDATHALGDTGIRSPNLPYDSDYDRKVLDTRPPEKDVARRTVFAGRTVATLNRPFDVVALTEDERVAYGLPEVVKTKAEPVPRAEYSWYWSFETRRIFATVDKGKTTIGVDEGITPRVAVAILNEWSQPDTLPASAEIDEALKWFDILGGPVDIALRHQPEDPKPVWEVRKNGSIVLVGVDAENRVVVETGSAAPPDSQKILDPALILHEVLELMRDTRAQPGSKPHDAYELAPALHLVLEFDVDENLPAFKDEKFDPVPKMLDLANCVFLKTMPLESVVGGATEQLPEYDLILENVFQAEDRICLAWDFVAEAATIRDAGEPFDVYREVEQFVVTRTLRSGASLEPKVTALRPAWLVSVDELGEETLIRPQFQFVDDEVANLPDGELLDYVVEARSPDRPLASFEITVVRQLVRPLAPIPQAQVVHVVRVEESRIVQELKAVVQLDELLVDDEQIRIGYRKSPASTIGAYGFDNPPPSPLGFDAPNSNVPSLRFPDSASLRPQPWANLTLLDVTEWSRLAAAKPTWVVKVVLPEAEVRDVGAAFEFFVYRESKGKPRRWSPLTRCRHAVLTRKPEPNGAELTDLDLSQPHVGNTVTAIEWIPDSALTLPSVLGNVLTHDVTYLPNDDIVTKNELVPPVVLKPSIKLSWPHDLRGRGGIDRPKADGFNPVVGYALERFDAYDPDHYTRDGALRVQRIDRLAVRTIPEPLYRATPSTVIVQGLKTEFAKSEGTLDEIVAGRLNPGEANADTGSFPVNPGDWKPIALLGAGTALTPPPVLGDGQKSYVLEDVDDKVRRRIEWPGGPVWIARELHVAIESIRVKLGGGRCELILNRPLVSRIADFHPKAAKPEEQPTEVARQFADRIGRLQSNLDRRHDPYGWHTLESLGRSCECLFFDVDNRAIPAEVVQRLIQATPLANVATCFFQAEDGRTLLNVVRFLVGRPLLKITTGVSPATAVLADVDLVRAALVQTMGSPAQIIPKPQSTSAAEPEPWDYDLSKEFGPECAKLLAVPDGWLADAQRWLTEVGVLAADDKFRPRVVFRQDSRYGMETDRPTEHPQSPEPVPQSKPALPIGNRGLIQYEVLVGDQWAHDYRFAVRPVRRYDLICDGFPVVPAPAADHTSWTRVAVDRTKPLAPPRLVATPLSGGVQFLALRHPAEFAANATVDNDARVQFNHQYFHWPERQIDPDVKKVLANVPTIDKSSYEVYIADVVAKEAKAKPVPLNHPLLGIALPGTSVGQYGVDRLVIPDAPAYYQYRTRCTASAGRMQTTSQPTAWVQPVVESDGQSSRRTKTIEPQVPRVKPPSETEFDKSTNVLAVEFEVALLRDLLTPEFRHHWTKSELTHETLGLPVGFLPDLGMEYQLYFRTDAFTTFEAKPGFQEFLPLARIKLSTNPLEVNNRPPGVTMAAAPAWKQNGNLFVTVSFAFDRSAPLTQRFLDRLLEVPRLPKFAPGDLRRLIAVQGVRRGALSRFTEFSSEAAT